jgi:hypothetical protein
LSDKIFKLDDVSWHIHEIDDNVALELREELAAAHIGLLIRWCFVNGYELQPEDDEEDIVETSERDLMNQVKSGLVPGIRYLTMVSDGKFISDIVSPRIRPFLRRYYGSEDAQYLVDFGNLFDRHAYKSREKEFDFRLFSRMLDVRFVEFGLMKNPDDKFGALRIRPTIRKFLSLFKK